MRTWALWVSLAVAVLPSAGCDGSEETSAYELIVSSADVTSEAETMGMRMTTTVAGGGTTFSMVMDGAASIDGSRAQYTIDLPDLGAPGADDVEVRIVDRVMYTETGILGEDGWLPEGVRWVSMDLDDVMEGLGLGATGLTRAGGPSQYAATLQSLRGVSDDVEDLGAEDLHGVSTTRYRVEVDVEKALAELPEGLADLTEKAIEALGSRSLPMEVWIDREGRVRRMVYEMSMDMDVEDAGEEGEGGGVRTEVDMELYDFGVEIDVERPPAEETADMTELLATQETGES